MLAYEAADRDRRYTWGPDSTFGLPGCVLDKMWRLDIIALDDCEMLSFPKRILKLMGHRDHAAILRSSSRGEGGARPCSAMPTRLNDQFTAATAGCDRLPTWMRSKQLPCDRHRPGPAWPRSSRSTYRRRRSRPTTSRRRSCATLLGPRGAAWARTPVTELSVATAEPARAAVPPEENGPQRCGTRRRTHRGAAVIVEGVGGAGGLWSSRRAAPTTTIPLELVGRRGGGQRRSPPCWRVIVRAPQLETAHRRPRGHGSLA